MYTVSDFSAVQVMTRSGWDWLFDRFVADIELRLINCLTRYDVRLSAAVGVAGIRGYSVLVGNKISVWQEEV